MRTILTFLPALGLLALALPALAAPVRQGVLQETWLDVPGGRVEDLRDSPRFAAMADEVRVLDRFEGRSGGDGFGSRLSALLVPPRTGDYTFWIASDDASELSLSTDETPAGKRPIARVTLYTAPGEWEREKGQRSDSVRLEAGRAYAIEALWKDEGGADHLQVAWSGPGIDRQVIEGRALRLPALDARLQAKVDETRAAEAKLQKLLARAESYWKVGKTLPVELTGQLRVSSEGPLANDTGINVLLDEGHQTSFAVLWGMRGQLRAAGFRVCTSLASLDTVLTPGKPSRIRALVGEMEPFAWWRTPEFNVVILDQRDVNASRYTEKEREALKRFVEAGGGLLVCGTRPKDAQAAADWSLNALLGEYGARYTEESDARDGKAYPTLALQGEWETLLRGEAGRPLRARRAFGKGRVLVCEGVSAVNPEGAPADEALARRQALGEMIAWLAAAKAPVGGDGRMAHVGGVGIFPELEKRAGSLVVYYAANQKPEVMECIEKHIPRAAQHVQAWLPTKQFAEPYTIVICGGGGGGWAINPRPKAAAVIAYDPLGILGIFAHEMAHTMAGPGNAQGVTAGISPHHNQGEAHAGWFQGKVLALFDEPARAKSNRDCNSILALEAKKGRKMDLAVEYENEAGRREWGKGPEWTKMWWVWQKLDDRYGPTWYPRWYWVRATRWAAEPGHTETWDEMVEEMSIAVGEDLFPFFRKIGTTLGRERLERIDFQGRTLELPVAPLDDGPAGNVRLDAIGDYTKPLSRPK